MCSKDTKIGSDCTTVHSWNDAVSICSQQNASLPSFNTWREITKFIQEIETSHKYDVETRTKRKCLFAGYHPAAVFIGYKVYFFKPKKKDRGAMSNNQSISDID